MESLESKCKKMLSALSTGDIEKYKRARAFIVADVSDNYFSEYEYGDGLTVGKALVVLLDDMSRKGVIYKRLVLIAMFALLKTIIGDKNDSKPQTAIASALLLILFSENQDFIGREYIASKVRTTEAAAHQFIGMSCVFLWKYKFNLFKQSLLPRTQQRLQKAISSSVIETPDVLIRKKVIDFEYENFNSILHDLPIDVDLKYPGMPSFDFEVDLPKIQSMFTSESWYVTSQEPSSVNNETMGEIINRAANNTSCKESSSGCLSVVTLLIIVLVIICSYFQIISDVVI